MSATALNDCLLAHKAKASVKSEIVGPRTVTYLLLLEPGAKVGKIENMHKDIAACLGVQSVRVRLLADGVSVEVPVKGHVVKAADLSTQARDLTFALGLDTRGQDVVFDLAAAPHLIVSGSTNSGKSVMLNHCLLQLIQANGTDTLRLALLDTKRVELASYAGLPHLIRPAAVEVARCLDLLDMLCSEMDRRYSLLEAAGVRDLAEYNRTCKPLPRIVIAVEELADLMLAMPDESQRLLGRLAAMGRAAGLHLILCTQRGDARVLTGILKANIPARISFAVPSQVDSRVILGQKGAEALLGRGDALYMEPGGNLIRLQGALYDPDQIEPLRLLHGPAEPFIDPRPEPKPFEWPPIPVYEPVVLRPVPALVNANRIIGWTCIATVMALIWAVVSSIK